jgi:hypothetical protein
MRKSISLTSGMALALVLGCALSGCGKLKQSDPGEDSRLRAEAKQHQSACGSSAAFEPLKGLLFDQAIQQHSGDRAALDTLADYSFVRLEDVVVTGWDPALDITRCRGRLILEVPAGARPAFSGQQHLRADIDYTAQTAADRNGFVYRLSGSVPFVPQLAAFHLNGQAYRPPAAFDEQPANTGSEAPVALARAEEPAALRNTAAPSRSRAAATPPPSALQRTSLPAKSEPAPPRQGLPLARSPGSTGEAIVRTFYGALGAGNGEVASAQVVPEKQGSQAYSPTAIARFYGRMPQPLQLTGVTPLAGGSYSVTYRYSTGRARCNGRAVVRITSRNGRQFIRSIQALSGC